MLSLDPQDTYFHIPVHPGSRRFLQLVWKDQPFQFTVPCFRLSLAPEVFYESDGSDFSGFASPGHLSSALLTVSCCLPSDRRHLGQGKHS